MIDRETARIDIPLRYFIAIVAYNIWEDSETDLNRCV